MAVGHTDSKAAPAIDYARHAEKLSLLPPLANDETRATTAVEAKFVTPQDPIIQTADGGRLPAVPLDEAVKLNELKNKAEGRIYEKSHGDFSNSDAIRHDQVYQQFDGSEAPLRDSFPSQRTHPLFPQLPLYGPPSILRNLECIGFRISSFFLSLTFLGTIVLGSAFTSIPLMLRHIGLLLTFRDPNARRPFYEKEKRKNQARKDAAREWKRQKRRRKDPTKLVDSNEEEGVQPDEYEPTEGGNDPLICDVGYYARRVGLDVEEYKVQTEDGFIITLWHVYNPLEHTSASAAHRSHRSPENFSASHVRDGDSQIPSGKKFGSGKPKYPVLLVHGLLQSAGAYCTNDDDSFAFFLCKRYTVVFRRNSELSVTNML